MVMTALLSAFRDARLKPTREVVVPALTRVVAPRTKARYLRHDEPLPVLEHLEDSVLDIHAWGPNAPNYLIDVTVRHPDPTQRAATDCGIHDGAAALAGDAEKLARYPPKDGLKLIPASIETWGRMSPVFCDLLRELAGIISVNQQAFGLARTRPLSS